MSENTQGTVTHTVTSTQGYVTVVEFKEGTAVKSGRLKSIKMPNTVEGANELIRSFKEDFQVWEELDCN